MASPKLKDGDIENELYINNDMSSENSNSDDDSDLDWNVFQKKKVSLKKKRSASKVRQSCTQKEKPIEDISERFKNVKNLKVLSARESPSRSTPTRKRKVQNGDSDVKSPKISCKTNGANSSSVSKTKIFNTDSNSKTDILEKAESPRKIKGRANASLPNGINHSPQKLSAKKNLFTPTKRLECSENESSVSKVIVTSAGTFSPESQDKTKNVSKMESVSSNGILKSNKINNVKINSNQSSDTSEEEHDNNNSNIKRTPKKRNTDSPLKCHVALKLHDCKLIRSNEKTPSKVTQNAEVSSPATRKSNKVNNSKIHSNQLLDIVEEEHDNYDSNINRTPKKTNTGSTSNKNSLNDIGNDQDSNRIYKLRTNTPKKSLAYIIDNNEDNLDSKVNKTPQKRTRTISLSKENSGCESDCVGQESRRTTNVTPKKEDKIPQKRKTDKKLDLMHDYSTPSKTKNRIASEEKRTPFSCSKFNELLTPVHKLSSPLLVKDITVTTPISKKNTKRMLLSPSMAKKEHRTHETPTKTEDSLDITRKQLHISTIPKSLPCRDTEFNQITSFLLRKIEHSAGGCMYISGVPGTGKTATVHAVIRSLQQKVKEEILPEFDFVEVNGLRLTEPRQAYVRILQALTNQKLTPDQSQQILNKRFSGTCKKSTIILVDELDYLCNRRQDVVYNILDWPTKRSSGLVVLTISNTMDLPERTLKGRVTSRMGLTRLVFQPYSHHQLREIVEDRLCDSITFHPDAVQLVARKVAAVSGDARRALDICRRTTELVQSGEQVTVSHVEKALTQIFSGPRVIVIQSLSRLSQLVLRSVRDVNQRSGVDEATVSQVYRHLHQICVLEGVELPTVGSVLQTCVSLVGLGLMVSEKGRMDIARKLSLNVSSDDIHYALDNLKI